ncbi:MAG: hypothetical protein KAU01_10090 [Candidatus Cloacimonetes bacterium]|nr:hypothetical protein [Candidatus Cloacimonadota bacterium]
MLFIVTKIFDGDTFEINPKWNWNDDTGKVIGLKGYNSPVLGQAGYKEAKERLEQLLLDKQVDLRNPVNLSTGRLLCDVFLDGEDVQEHLGSEIEE